MRCPGFVRDDRARRLRSGMGMAELLAILYEQRTAPESGTASYVWP
jgi:hypothetical protein